MSSQNLPNPQDEQYDPNLEAQDEEVASGGNNRLVYILGGLLVALVVGYVALPKGHGTGLASVTPTFMLDDAAVTATAPTAADSIAAGLKTDPTTVAATDAKEAKTTAKPVASQHNAATATAAVPVATAAAAPAPAAVAETAPAPAPAAAPEPTAPTSSTVSGKIEDENGRPMVGATVLLKGSSKGTSTDANGNYSLEVPSGNDNTLIYGYGGYDDEIVRAKGNQPLNVTLTPRAKADKRRR